MKGSGRMLLGFGDQHKERFCDLEGFRAYGLESVVQGSGVTVGFTGGFQLSKSYPVTGFRPSEVVGSGCSCGLLAQVV